VALPCCSSRSEEREKVRVQSEKKCCWKRDVSKVEVENCWLNRHVGEKLRICYQTVAPSATVSLSTTASTLSNTNLPT
jgi:hypothetical protein